MAQSGGSGGSFIAGCGGKPHASHSYQHQGRESSKDRGKAILILDQA